MEVFTSDGASEEDVYGANSNSLIGSGLSLVAGNNCLWIRWAHGGQGFALIGKGYVVKM
jgi:hypothetical protein